MANAANITRHRARSTKSKRNEVVAGLMAKATSASKAIRVLSGVLAETMEEIHGEKFVVVIDHDAPMILIRPI